MDEFGEVGGTKGEMTRIAVLEVVDLGVMGYRAVDVSVALKVPALTVEQILKHSLHGTHTRH